MTVSSTETPRREHNGNGSTTNFPIPFPYAAEADVNVIHIDADENETTWEDPADYFLSGDEIVAVTAPASGEKLVIYRSTAKTQGQNLKNNRRLPGPIEEAALDKLTYIVQELSEEIGRCVQNPITAGEATLTPEDIESAESNAAAAEAAAAAATAAAASISGIASGITADLFIDGTDYTAGTTDQLTISSEAINDSSLLVFFDGVQQESSEWSVSGTVITFGSAIPGGTTSVQIIIFPVLSVVTPVDGSVTKAKLARSGFASFYSVEEKAGNYSILVTDEGKLLILGSSTAANKTFSCPSVGSSEDGMELHFDNQSDYELTISPADSDSIGPSGDGYGITLLPGAGCSIKYRDSEAKYDVFNVKGRIHAEGLKLWFTGNELAGFLGGSSSRTVDLTGRHSMLSNFAVGRTGGNYPNSFAPNGTDSGDMPDSADWDLFSSSVTDATLLIRGYFDNAASSNEILISHYEDSNNYWYVYRNSSGQFVLVMRSGGVNQINIYGGSLSASTWYDLTVKRVGSDVGIYVDSAQVGHEGSFSEDTFSGSLYIAQRGDSSLYLDGKINDIMLIRQNIFNAAPVAGLTDTITIPENLNLIIGA